MFTFTDRAADDEAADLGEEQRAPDEHEGAQRERGRALVVESVLAGRDGVADSASGVIRISGPTYDAEGMAWSTGCALRGSIATQISAR